MAMSHYKKAGSLICKGLHIGEDDLEKINTLTRREFSEDELYCFRVVLCDNDIDRDMEQFDQDTLEELARLFVGKTGICDHEAASRNQQARIYEVAVENFPGKVNALGEPYYAVVAKAYMVRTESNRDLILEIEAGIKKEVSVGCSVRESICSICGKKRSVCECGHVVGEVYDGKMCYTILHGAADAYEWSFVAVPAQRQAGIIKSVKSTVAAASDFTQSTVDTVQKLWKAAEYRRGLWLSEAEVLQLQGRVKNLMEDCEQVRRMTRKEVMHAFYNSGEMNENINRELSAMLDELSVEQMRTLKKLIRKESTELTRPQFTPRSKEQLDSDKRFMI